MGVPNEPMLNGDYAQDTIYSHIKTLRRYTSNYIIPSVIEYLNELQEEESPYKEPVASSQKINGEEPFVLGFVIDDLRGMITSYEHSIINRETFDLKKLYCLQFLLQMLRSKLEE